jgi:hypothetical protein
MELSETYDLPFAALINSDLYGLLSGTGRWVQRAGDEIVAHRRSSSERQIDMTPLEELACIEERAIWLFTATRG